MTYAPLQGEDFVTHLLTPVRLRTLQLLIETGWSIDRVLRLCVQRLGETRNAPSASGPAPDRAPAFEQFRQVSTRLRELEKRDGLRFLPGPRGLAIEFGKGEADSAAVREISEILELEAGAEGFVLTKERRATDDANTVVVETRSLMGSLFYLSQAVEPPQAHVDAGWVTVTRRDDGTPFRWDALMQGLFAVRTSAKSEGKAFVAVRYLGRTFEIAQHDLDTKATFLLLNQLFALRAGPPGGGGPLLTLPVSR